MQRALKAEWTKLMRRGMILGGGGTMVGLGVLVTFLIFGLASDEDVQARGPGISASLLEGPDGLTSSLGFTSKVLGGVSLVLYARTVTNEYRHGTLKAMLAREPRRLVFLSAKFAAMTLFLIAALIVTTLAIVTTANLVALARGIDAGAWRTDQGIAETLFGSARLLVACVVWGLFGFALGTVFRSGGTAIGIGIGVLAIGGHVIDAFWANADKWLPDIVLSGFTTGGTENASMVWLSVMVVSDAIVLAAVSGTAFTRGDVKG